MSLAARSSARYRSSSIRGDNEKAETMNLSPMKGEGIYFLL
jgi:hypothetical protein